MKAQFFPLILLVATTSFAEEDLRSKVAEANDYKTFNSVIDPDKSIFGIPLGTTEEAFIKQHGKPVAYTRLKGDETCMIYTESIGFLFKNGGLAGVLVDDWDMVNYTLQEKMNFNRVFPSDLGDTWELSNGIKPEMSLLRVKQIVGDKLSQDEPDSRFSQTFLTEKSRVTLTFSHRSARPDDDEDAYNVSSIAVWPQ